ncbi:MAG: hypothetical protein JNJ45_12450 [Chthonomonas sp.]|nr:hypothetical protein [Chthonomonas sp.]
MRVLLPLVVALGAVPAVAGAPQFVTRAEASMVFAKMATMVKQASNVQGAVAFDRVKEPKKPITRSEVVHAYYLLYMKAKPGFRLTPVMTKFDPKLISGLDEAVKGEAKILAQWGFIGPVGPLVTDMKPQVSVQVFGDSVGLFLSRLADLTHTPSSKYSPNLMIDPPPKRKN